MARAGKHHITQLHTSLTPAQAVTHAGQQCQMKAHARPRSDIYKLQDDKTP